MATVHPDVGTDSGRLLHLCGSGFVGTFTAASPRPFTRASAAEQDARLEAWRRSRLALLRGGYQGPQTPGHLAERLSGPQTSGRRRLLFVARRLSAHRLPGPPVGPAAPGGRPMSGSSGRAGRLVTRAELPAAS